MAGFLKGMAGSTAAFNYLSQFATGQLLLQLVNVLNGFFLLRWLSVPEQAKFSVAFSIQTLVLSLSDLGFTGSIIALVGSRIHDQEKIGAYIRSARVFRTYLFFGSCAITLLLLPAIIEVQAWSYVELAIMMVPVLLAVFWQADCSLYDSTLVMHRKMRELYLPQVLISGVKLTINFVLYLGGIIGSFTTLTVNAIALLATGRVFRKKALPYVSFTRTDVKPEMKEMFSYLKPLLPSLIFNALYGQIQILIISFFGNTSNIAEVAALGRLAQLFIFLNTLNLVVVSPYVAKLDSPLLTKKYFQILSGGILMITFIYGLSSLIPEFFLFLIGPKYSHLKPELHLMVLNACLAYFGALLWTMHSARKWVFWWGTWSYMICVVMCQCIGIVIFDVGTTHGVLQLSALTLSVMLLVHTLTAVMGFNSLKRHMTQPRFPEKHHA
ncbi:MAG TPA: hypothetical protein VG737_04340 [Cyclobacteriaceae bacterium]|nr:hypothetical protein [Cyclobacteriaceae bacterium]